MNLPNAITMLRFLLIPLYLGVFFESFDHHILYALLILLFAGLTDVLDGHLARRYGQITEIGSLLDPLADKLMVLAVFLSLVVSHAIPDLLAGLILARELGMIAVSAYFHVRGKKTVPATIWGKSTTVLYYLTILTIMFGWSFSIVLLWLTVAVSFLTSFVYLTQFRLLNRPVEVDAERMEGWE
ncbi:CDP-diacylglycerol--glycerol-3-phosphate 3-phosphatidyltransferase [Fodinisporobacter ferrooxydans]|uniref:CDP-diacylglycerol--glycerol-3-phosphate 3-phosphatidyltransferase n=1 Tax=Fodinisporobacter ferrooxydans TaxID=2901836 RepID=A0ABY4CMF2_9BACL|nr:CDP-diacylglycerol--glycerol-3-phosphate 3-phosphatidyltransferase [Alicyclobacillaceae bacterium MYW30-H2]